jgi:lipoate-protein ligase A
VREDGALLQHGSILIDDDQQVIQELLAERSAEVEAPRAATLHSILGRVPTVDEVAHHLFESVRELEDAGALSLGEADVAEATAAERGRFDSELWTWRR